MTCFAPKCTIKKEGERQITCWLCDDLFHMKCIGLMARTTDQLMDSAMGLRWCCLKCRKVDIEFYKFFIGTRNEFSDMHKELASLYAKFRKFEERYNKFGELNKLVESDMSPSSPKRRKVVENVTVGVLPPIVIDRDVNPTVEISVPPGTTTCGAGSQNLIELDPKSPIDPRSSNNVVTVNNVDNNSVQSTNIVVNTVNSVNTVLSNRSNSSNNSAINTLQTKKTVSSSAQPINTVQTKKSGSSAAQPNLAPRQLRVVRPRRTIFISRLAPDSIDLDLIHYVNSKFGETLDIHCVKINPIRARGISSFRLTVPYELFDKIVDPEFWPLGILVREFVHRERPGNNPVYLPTAIQSQAVLDSQKN